MTSSSTWSFVFFSFSLGMWAVGGQGQGAGSGSRCLQRMEELCGRHFTALGQLTSAASASNVQICQAADVVISCAADVISQCDVMEGAYLAETIKLEVIQTHGPEGRTRCSAFRNASLAVFADDSCRQQLAECASLLLQAELRALPPSSPSSPSSDPASPSASRVDPVFACLFLTYFSDCVARQLRACPSDLQRAAHSKVQGERTHFNDLYRCAQRKGEVQLEQCIGDLEYNRDRLERDQLCQLYEETKQCAEAAKTQGSLDLAPAAFDHILAKASAFALQEPFFCLSDNPCLEIVKACNATTTAKTPPQHPCQLQEVYTHCLTQSLHRCGRQHQVPTRQQVEQAKLRISQQFNCEDRVTSPSPTPVAGGSTPCDQVVLTCGQSIRDALDRGEDRTRVCQSVDSFVTCVVEGSRRCDAVSTAAVKKAANDVITTTSCALERGQESALQMTLCDEALVNCSTELVAADSILPFDPLTSCRAFKAYVQCTRGELKGCDAAVLADVRNDVQRVTARFTVEPFFCDFRDRLTSLGADQYFAVCQSDLFTVLDSRAPLQDICTAVDSFGQCVTKAKASASGLLRSEFESVLSQLTEPYTLGPFFCTAQHPCLERFLDCRQLSASRVTEPCMLQLMADSCQEKTSATCMTRAELAALTAVAVRDRDLLEQTHHCSRGKSETASTSPTTSTTTATTTTTTTIATAITADKPTLRPSSSIASSSSAIPPTIQTTNLTTPETTTTTTTTTTTNTTPPTTSTTTKTASIISNAATISPSPPQAPLPSPSPPPPPPPTPTRTTGNASVSTPTSPTTTAASSQRVPPRGTEQKQEQQEEGEEGQEGQVSDGDNPESDGQRPETAQREESVDRANRSGSGDSWSQAWPVLLLLGVLMAAVFYP